MKWFSIPSLYLLCTQPSLLLADDITLTQIPLIQSTPRWNAGIIDELKKQGIITLQQAPLKTTEQLHQTLSDHSIIHQQTNSPIIYNPEKWKIDKQEAFSLLKEPANKPNPQPPTCSWARLIPNKGSGLYLYNISFEQKSKELVNQAVELIVLKVKDREYIDEPVILTSNLDSKKFPEAHKRLSTFTDFREITLSHKVSAAETPLMLHPKLTSVNSSTLSSPPTAISHSLKWDPVKIESEKHWRFFKETVLDKEIGDGNGIVVKWKIPEISIRVIGGTKKQQQLVNEAITELNDALKTTTTKLVISDQATDNEIRCYIGTYEELKPICKLEKISPPFDYAGFATVFWFTETAEIDSSVVLIPTDRSEEKDIPHVIREEMTQALGLPGDNTVLPESITYSRGFDHGNSSTLCITPTLLTSRTSG